MTNLLTLTKVDFMASFGIGKSKREKKQARSFKTIIILVIVVGLALSTLYNFIFCSYFVEGAKQTGVSRYEGLIPAQILFVGVAGLLTLTTSVMKVKSIFMGQDYEMLAAMPVTKREIITSKILSLYFVELLYSAIILIPNTILVTAFGQDWRFAVAGFFAIFLAPAVPMVLATLIAMFISMVADRFKGGNIISLVFYIIFFAAIFSMSFLTSQSVDQEGQLNIGNYILLSNIFGWMNPTTMLIKLAHTVNYLFILIYIPANLILVLAVVSFIALFFERVHEIITSQKNNNVYVQQNLEVVPQNKCLFKHEAKRFFNSKFYFINSISSGIVAVIMSAMLGYMMGPFSTMIPQSEELRMVTYSWGHLGFVVIAFGIGIATPASVAISIEGKNFWMLKAYPVDYKALLRAKFWLSTLVLWVPGALAGVVLGALLQTAWYNYIFLVLLTEAYVALSSILSLRINLKRYKFDWKNEQECCKNSSAVVLTMLLDWGIMLVISGVSVGLTFINPILAGCVTFLGIALAAFLFYKNTIKTAEKRIERIEC